MRILISADIEGVSGVCLPEQTTPGSQEYERARRLMTAEVNAAAQGVLDGASDTAATEIWVVDGHGPYRNILFEELHPDVRLVSGKPRFLGMLAGLAEGGPWDGLFLLGYHTGAGSWGVLAHTINGGAFHRIFINGQPVNEAFINSALAGEYGVPVRLVSGDDLLAEEVKPFLPDAERVVVKRALGHRAAVHLSPARTHEALRLAARRSLHSKAAPHCPQGPFHVQVSTVRPAHADCFAQVPGVKRTGPAEVDFIAPRMEDAVHFLNTFSAMSASLG